MSFGKAGYEELTKLPTSTVSKAVNTYVKPKTSEKKKVEVVLTREFRQALAMVTLESFAAEKLRINNAYLREAFAEFIGTFVLIAFGCGVNASVTLSGGNGGSFLSVNWGWGMGIAMGVWVSAGVSGGHINPALSMAMAIIGRLQLKKLPVYWAAQYLGAFVASACVFGVYHEALDHYDGGVRQVVGENATAGIWGTFPQNYLTNLGGLGDQVFGTMLLLLCVMAITDSRNVGPARGMVPLCVGLIVFTIGMTFGYNCGFAINPARDLSPRIFTACAGWGAEVFWAHGNWWWVPVVGPHIGAVCGVAIYLILVGFHFDDGSEFEVEPEMEEEIKDVTLTEVRCIPDQLDINDNCTKSRAVDQV